MKQVNIKDGASTDIVQENVEQLKDLFPEAFTENGVNFDTLRQLLGDLKVLDEGEEKFGLNWHGKKQARQIALTPSLGTLLPCPEESVNWDTTQNLFIEGDNLEVLKLLQKSYANQVKMIYIDPPYNTGKEFVYPDKFQDNLDTYLKYTGQVDDEGMKFTSNTETSGRKHTNWLNMMYPRLKLAKNLLHKTGFVFISIADHEIANLKEICNEIFGEDNFVAQFIWNTEGHTDNQYDVKVNHEYILCYSKSHHASMNYVIDPNTREESNLWKGYAENSITKNGSANPPSYIELRAGFPCKSENLELPTNVPNEDFFKAVENDGYIMKRNTKEYDVSYPIRFENISVKDGLLQNNCKVYSGWANADKLRTFINGGCKPIDEGNGNILSFYLSERGVIYYKRQREKARNIVSVLKNMGTTEQMKSELEELGIPFSYPKPKLLLKYLITLGTGEGENIIMDFFAGSGSFAQASIELSQENDSSDLKYIVVQLPEALNPKEAEQKPGYQFCKAHALPPNIAEIAKERIRRVLKQVKKTPSENNNDIGFKVFKLASSNIKAWNPDRTDLEASLLDHQEHLVEGRSEQDILYELLLKRGVDLTAPIETKQIADKSVHSIGFGKIITCLDELITGDEVEELSAGIIAWQKQLKETLDVETLETHIFFRDSAFRDDIAKTNMAAILSQSGITHVRSL